MAKVKNIKLADGTLLELGGSGGGGLPMFTSIWSDHLLNDASYLRADTFSWHSADIYITGYNIIEAEYDNENCIEETENGVTYRRSPNGFKIADASQHDNVLSAYNSTGIAWFYIIDKANRRFKLPRTEYGFTGVRDGVGLNVEAGLPNIVGGFDVWYSTILNHTGAFIGSSPTTNGGSEGANKQATYYDHTEINASLSNPIYGNNDTVQPPATQMYLYFYIGEYERPETEVNLGVLTELANGLDLNAIVGEINDVSSTGLTNISNATQTGLTSVSSAVTEGINAITDTTNTGKAELQKIITDKVPVATIDNVGLVKPDGTTIAITEDGIISSIGGGSVEGALTYQQIANNVLTVPERVKMEVASDNMGILVKEGTIVTFPIGAEDLSADYPIGSDFNSFAKVVRTDYIENAPDGYSSGTLKFFVTVEVKQTLDLYTGDLSLYTEGGNIRVLTLNTYGDYLDLKSLDYDSSQAQYDIGSSLPLAMFDKDGSLKPLNLGGIVFNSYNTFITWVYENVSISYTDGFVDNKPVANKYTTERLVFSETIPAVGSGIDAIYVNRSFCLTPKGIIHNQDKEIEYNVNTNYLENKTDKTNIVGAEFLTCKYKETSGLGWIETFNPKQPFRAVGYSDKSTVSGWAFPSSRYVDLTSGASGTTYEAPANGWFYLSSTSTATNQGLAVSANSMAMRAMSSAASQLLQVYLPVAKGNITTIVYSTTSNVTLRFIYAQGEI